MKRIISFIIILSIILSLCGIVSLAAEKRAAFFCPRCGGSGYTMWNQSESVITVPYCVYKPGVSHKHVLISTVDTAVCDDCNYTWVVDSYLTSEWCAPTDQLIQTFH